MNFDVFFKKTLCLAKMATTFAYELGLKSFLYEKVTERLVCDRIGPTSARLIQEMALLYMASSRALTDGRRVNIMFWSKCLD
jgi:hypothetical protein